MFLAIDIVLLPDDKTLERVEKYNQQLVEQGNTKIVFDKAGKKPHISLLMGIVDKKSIESVANIVQTKATHYSNRPLVSLGLAATQVSGEEFVFHIHIKNTQALQRLHETLIKSTQPYLCDQVQVNESHFWGKTASQSSLHWVQKYLDDSGYVNFIPHITLGFGFKRLQYENEFPFEFKPNKLAIFQLSEHCTCEHLLFECDLK